MQGKLLIFIRLLFLASILISAGFMSCLTAMRYAIRGSEVSVPSLIGTTLQEGIRLASASELHLKVESHRFDDQVQKDRILSQTPSPNSKLKRNRNVKVIVSSGAKKVPVPDLDGESLRASQLVLLDRGLSFGVTSWVHYAEIEKDRIISQDPAPQTQLALTPLVNVLVSSGKRSREYLMPDLTGRTWEEVSRACEESGFKVGRVGFVVLPGISRGTILKQNPLPGYKLIEGSSVDLEVSQ